MPDLNDIAQALLPGGGFIPSRIPIGNDFSSTTTAVFVSGESVPVAVYLTLEALAAVGSTWLFLPPIYRTDGVTVDATDEIADIAADDALVFRFAGVEAHDGGEFSFAATVKSAGTSRLSQRPLIIFPLPDFPAGTDLSQTIVGKTLGIERDGASLLPAIPAVEPHPLWVRRGDVLGDFSAVAVTGEDVLETTAVRTVRLETNYDPRLEDLDTRIEYGSTADGTPIVWRIQSIERGERSLFLNLAAAVT
ncbi:MAG: unc-93 family MFS transporter [Gemmatimonadales bacterium]|nr:unc-93 family MFS transporter [Candidatus Palauibacter ramosifaciens]